MKHTCGLADEEEVDQEIPGFCLGIVIITAIIVIAFVLGLVM